MKSVICPTMCSSPAKLTSSILLAQVREAPHVSQAHREAHLGQDVLQFAVPCRTAIVFGHLYLWDFIPSCPSDVQGTILVVKWLLVCEQVSHWLCNMLMALLALRHFAVLRHQGGWGSGKGWGWREKERESETETGRNSSDTGRDWDRWM